MSPAAGQPEAVAEEKGGKKAVVLPLQTSVDKHLSTGKLLHNHKDLSE